MWIGTAYKPHEILLKKPLSQLWCYIHSKKIENTKELKPYISLVCLYFGKLTWRLCLFVLLKNHLFYRTSNCFIILAVSLVCSVCFCLHNCFTDTWWDPEKLWCTYTVSLLWWGSCTVADTLDSRKVERGKLVVQVQLWAHCLTGWPESICIKK